MRALNHTLRLTSASLLAMVLGSYVFSSAAHGADGEDLARINSSVEVDDGDSVRDVSSVNGSISN